MILLKKTQSTEKINLKNIKDLFAMNLIHFLELFLGYIDIMFINIE